MNVPQLVRTYIAISNKWTAHGPNFKPENPAPLMYVRSVQFYLCIICTIMVFNSNSTTYQPSLLHACTRGAARFAFKFYF